jgi:hypothetical protein
MGGETLVAFEAVLALACIRGHVANKDRGLAGQHRRLMGVSGRDFAPAPRTGRRFPEFGAARPIDGTIAALLSVLLLTNGYGTAGMERAALASASLAAIG